MMETRADMVARLLMEGHTGNGNGGSTLEVGWASKVFLIKRGGSIG